MSLRRVPTMTMNRMPPPERRLFEHCRLFPPEQPSRLPARERLEAALGAELATALVAALTGSRGAGRRTVPRC
jgi:hypothetical protein